MSELRVMSVMAHQDDFEFEAAGLFLKLRQHYGDQVRLKILTTTRGGSGHYLHDVDTTAAIRDQEARASAALVGAEYENMLLLDGKPLPGQVFIDRNFMGGLWNAIRSFAPHYIICPPVSVDPLAGVHIDHQHTAEAVRLVAYQLGVPHAYPTMKGEMVLRYKPPVILNCIDGYASECRWHFRVDVNGFKEKKLQMLRCHKSQLEEWLPFVNNLDKEEIPSWSEEEWTQKTDIRHLKRNELCNVHTENWNEYFSVTAWGGGSWNDPTALSRVKKDFPFAQWK
ncbi:MAG: PIG-L family deacetylase [Lentisphaeria bacterium]|nr:PIG-L family deacetylase [Lentisphaeria bacterium]